MTCVEFRVGQHALLADGQHSVCNGLHCTADADDLQVIFGVCVAVCRRAVLLADRNDCGSVTATDRASMLIAQGVDVRTVASLLGHAQASTTLDIYAHAFDKNKRKAQEKLGKAIGL